MILTSDLLLESVKRGISFTSTNEGLDDDDLLAFAYEEVVSLIVPELTALRQEFLVTSKTIDLVDGTASYRLPYRAYGRTLRDVVFVDASGNRRSLPMIQPEDAHRYQPTSTSEGPPQAFYLQNDHIVVVPTPDSSSEDLIVTFPMRPSKIVATDEVGTVSAVNFSTGVVTLAAALSTVTTSTATDFVCYRSGNIIKAYDLTPTNVASTQVTYTAASLPTDLAAGDYLCLAQQSPVVPIPEEAVVVLARAVQNRVLGSIGDLENLQIGQQVLNQRLAQMRSALTPRVEGEAPVILGGALRHFLGGGRRRYPKISVE
ncbi:MAG TPA: hypothetical protein VEB22_12320 [Phycisphaerales bacterium]|nr:hypothetical protein [Phycisphaerales bacterium]